MTVFTFISIFLTCMLAYISLSYRESFINYICNARVSHRVHDTESVPEASRHPLSTSVWCRGDSRSTRHCRFENICYRRDIDEFLFVHGTESVMTGFGPRQRAEDDGQVADLTSVEELNVHRLVFTDVPVAALANATIKLLEGDTLFLKRFKPDNLMHVIHDDVLPTFATLRELCFGKDEACLTSIRLALMDGDPEGPFIFYYRLVSNNILLSNSMDEDTIYCFRRAYIGINKETTWYNYGFSVPQHPIPRRACGRTIRKFVQHALASLEIRREDCAAYGKPYTVLVSRKHNRMIVNEEEVIRTIRKVTSLDVVELEDTDQDQRRVLELLACSEMLIGVHGATLILSIFMRPNSVLLELFPYGVGAEDYSPYGSLAAIPEIGLVYASWENTILQNTRTYPDRPAHIGGLMHLDEAERQRIVGRIKVAPHLCCSDPEWLFRIYQDTLVDVAASFKDILESAWERQQMSRYGASADVFTTSLHPGKVRQAICKLTPINGVDGRYAYLLTWTEPWNVQFLTAPGSKIQYEIWMQKIGEEDLVSVVTYNNWHIVPRIDEIKFDCWINCIFENKTSNRQWVRCQ